MIIPTQKRHNNNLLAFIFFFGYILLSIFVLKGFLQIFDMLGREAIRTVVPTAFLPVAAILDRLLNSRVVTVFFLLHLLFFEKKRRGKILFLYFLMSSVEVVSKLILPQHNLSAPLIRNLSQYIPFLDWTFTKFAYPSGHIARTIFFGFVFLNKIRVNNKKLWFLFLYSIFVVIVAVSRIYLFRHWPSDVFGGLLLGLSFGLLVLNEEKTQLNS